MTMFNPGDVVICTRAPRVGGLINVGDVLTVIGMVKTDSWVNGDCVRFVEIDNKFPGEGRRFRINIKDCFWFELHDPALLPSPSVTLDDIETAQNFIAELRKQQLC